MCLLYLFLQRIHISYYSFSKGRTIMSGKRKMEGTWDKMKGEAKDRFSDMHPSE